MVDSVIDLDEFRIIDATHGSTIFHSWQIQKRTGKLFRRWENLARSPSLLDAVWIVYRLKWPRPKDIN